MLAPVNHQERHHIASLRAHPLLANITTIDWDDLLALLLQRRFLSLSIVNVYEAVIDALTNDAIKVTVRLILHEEYPRNTRGQPLASHRELLFRDLLHLGASREQILGSSESPATQQVRLASLEALQSCLFQPHSDLALIAFLRFWAEVLVSVEYECLWPRLSERLAHDPTAQGTRSEFFYYHMIHDRRQSDIGAQHLLGGLTHSQELACHMANLINSEEALAIAIAQVDRAWELKDRFYRQFLPPPATSLQPMVGV
ncbi:MAG: hypothetical protein ACKO6F_07615 [Cyanobium sp.]